MQAFLSEPILSSKLGLVLAVSALAAVVVLEASDALTAEHPIADSLAALGSGCCCSSDPTSGSVEVLLLLMAVPVGHNVVDVTTVLLVAGMIPATGLSIDRCLHLLLRRAVAQVQVGVLWRPAPSPPRSS